MKTTMEGIRPRREALQITQAEASAAIGVNRYSLMKWETGQAMPSAQYLPALAVLLHCSIEDLYVSYELPEEAIRHE